MGYTDLLIKSYNLSRHAHQLAKMLDKAYSKEGKFYIPEGCASKIVDFLVALETYGVAVGEYEKENKKDESNH